MGTVKKHFLFNYEWAEVLSEYSGEVRLEVYDAIIRYAQSGTLSELKPQAKMAFSFIKKEMDRNETKYMETVSNGKRGGNPNFKKGTPNPYYNSKKDKDMGRLGKITQDNHHITQDNLNEYDNDYVNDYVSSSPSIPRGDVEDEEALEKKIEDYKNNKPIWKDGIRKKFKIPLDEVDLYLDEFALDMKCREINVRKVSALFDSWLTERLKHANSRKDNIKSWYGNNGKQFRGSVDFDCGLIEE